MKYTSMRVGEILLNERSASPAPLGEGHRSLVCEPEGEPCRDPVRLSVGSC